MWFFVCCGGCYAVSMKVFTAVLLACWLFSQSAHALVNSTEVSDEQFDAEYPWVVAVVNKGAGDVCGGVLIAPNWVLSAGHCTNINRYILVGSASQKSARRIDILRSIRHPKLDRETMQFDVGLMELAEPVDIPAAILPTEAQARSLLVRGRTARLAGWGRIERRRGAVERLRTGTVQLDRLGLRGAQIIYDYKGGGPCGQDSGSPMVMEATDGGRFVVGVASVTDGELCTQGGGIAIYTNLAAVRAFILKHVDSIW
jgi:secreted trypsin-like serine protease